VLGLQVVLVSVEAVVARHLQEGGQSLVGILLVGGLRELRHVHSLLEWWEVRILLFHFTLQQAQRVLVQLYLI